MTGSRPLPYLSLHILLALFEGPAHGWLVIQRIHDLTESRLNPSSGSLYLAMLRLTDEGLIRTVQAPSNEDPRRRYYELTPEGRLAARSEAERLARLVAHARRWDLLGADQ